MLCCLYRIPVLPATGYLRSFGGLGRTCIIDLYAGVSTAQLICWQFPPGGVEVLPSTSVTLMSNDSGRRGCAGNGHSPGASFITDLARNARLYWTSPGELSAGRELRGRTGLYKAGFIDRIASVYVDSDWVTPLRISPQTCTGLFPIGVALSSVI